MSFDRRVFQLIQHRAGELRLLDPLLLGCARYGSYGEIGFMLLLGLRGGQHGRSAAVRCLMAVATIYPLAELLGRLVGRSRPFATDPGATALLEHTPGRSFPSRHVASGVAMAVIARSASRPLGSLMAALVVAMGLGRIRAGLHYPSDALGGVALGSVVGCSWRNTNR